MFVLVGGETVNKTCSIVESLRFPQDGNFIFLLVAFSHARHTPIVSGRAAGLDTNEVVTGEQIKLANEGELEALAGSMNVFARVLPERKLRIVQAMKRNGEIVR